MNAGIANATHAAAIRIRLFIGGLRALATWNPAHVRRRAAAQPCWLRTQIMTSRPDDWFATCRTLSVFDTGFRRPGPVS
jgi:hypothetical protein